MNYIKQVANMLGLELGEEFKLSNCTERWRFWVDGLQCCDTCDEEWEYLGGSILEDIMTGQKKITKKPWVPKQGEIYYRVTRKGRIIEFSCDKDASDAAAIFFGNCFKTVADAEAHKIEIMGRMQEILDGKIRAEFVSVE